MTREQARNILRNAAWLGTNEDRERIERAVELLCGESCEKLPSVTPKQRTGHWIEKDGFDGDVYYDCSECGESWTTIEGAPWQNGMRYCPQCGCRMVEPKERNE